MALLGCSDSNNTPGTTTKPAETPGSVQEIPDSGVQAQTPGVRYIDCPIDASKLSQELRCGVLDTYENYELTGPNARMIQVAFGRIPAQTTPAAPDPIVVFIGGPGASALADFAVYDHFKSYTSNRELIIVDQRGAGFSTPFLDCDALSGNDQSSIKACVDKFEQQGGDLSQYRSTVIAQDFKVLREALDIEQWNIFGNSYGPIAGILYADLDRAGVRSVIFSSSTDNQVQLALADVAAPLDFITELSAQCAAEALCSERIPDLRSLFIDTYRSLNNEPWDIDIPDLPDTGGALVFQVMEVIEATQYPAVLDIIANRNGDQLLKLLASGGDDPLEEDTNISESVQQRFEGAELMQAAVDCAALDANNFDTAIIPTRETWPDDLMVQARRRVSYAQNCSRGMASIKQDLSQREPRMLDVPALIMGGALDDIVSIAQVRKLAESFTSPNLAIVQKGGHGVGFPAADIPIPRYQHPCLLSIVSEFLDNLEQAPDMACLTRDIPPFSFDIGS